MGEGASPSWTEAPDSLLEDQPVAGGALLMVGGTLPLWLATAGSQVHVRGEVPQCGDECLGVVTSPSCNDVELNNACFVQ